MFIRNRIDEFFFDVIKGELLYFDVTVTITQKLSPLTVTLHLNKFNLSNKEALSLFHINTCSLPKNIEELRYLIDKTKIDFDLIID